MIWKIRSAGVHLLPVKRVTLAVIILLAGAAIWRLLAGHDQNLVVQIGSVAVAVDRVWFDDATAEQPAEASAIRALFESYMAPASFDAYMALFRPEDRPNFSATEFANWRTMMAGRKQRAIAVFVFEVDGRKFGVVHHATALGGQELHEHFLTKNIEGKWWPLHRSENASFAPIGRFFAQARPRALRLLAEDLSREDRALLDAAESFSQHKDELERVIRLKPHPSGSGLVEYVNGLYASADPKDVRLAELLCFPPPGLTGRAVVVTPEVRRKHERLVQQLVSKSYSNDEVDRVVGHLERGEMLAAAKSMMQCEGGSSVHEYVMRIRSLYGEDAIRIWSSKDQQFH